MWEMISLGTTLFFLAAIWPPYNVFIAQSLSEKNLLLYLLVVIPGIGGLMVGGLLLGYGTKLLGIPLELIGGIFILGVALRMLWPKKNQSTAEAFKKKVSGSIQAALSCFLMSIMPGVFTVSMGTAISTANMALFFAVFIGSTLGIHIGGILLYKGAAFAKLPLDKLGGVLLLFIGILTIKPYL